LRDSARKNLSIKNLEKMPFITSNLILEKIDLLIEEAMGLIVSRNEIISFFKSNSTKKSQAQASTKKK
jgi:hypothetical protein